MTAFATFWHYGKEFVRVKEVARVLGVTPTHLRWLEDNGKLPFKRVKRAYPCVQSLGYLADDLRDFMAECAEHEAEALERAEVQHGAQ